MESTMKIGNDMFSCERDMIDVTMLSRPDTSWRSTDSNGHEHRWFVESADGPKPAENYSPQMRYGLPTVRWIVDIEASDEYPEYGHHECLQCGDKVTPRYCPDRSRQMIPGLSYFSINDQPVTKEEFIRRAREAGANI